MALMLSLKLGLQSRAFKPPNSKHNKYCGARHARANPTLPRNRRIPNSYRNSRLGNFKLEPRVRSWGMLSLRLFAVHGAVECGRGVWRVLGFSLQPIP